MMPQEVLSTRRRNTRVLAATLVAGAVYDYLFAALFVFAPGFLAVTFDLPLPAEAFYLRLLAVLLVMVGTMYLVAARDPASYRPLVAIAIAGRLLGAIGLAASAYGRSDLAGLWPPAAGDLAFALAHALAARGIWR